MRRSTLPDPIELDLPAIRRHAAVPSPRASWMPALVSGGATSALVAIGYQSGGVFGAALAAGAFVCGLLTASELRP